MLTLGYGICVIGFIRVGERIMQRFGPRLPMVAGGIMVILAAVMLGFTNMLVEQYVVLAIVAYCLFGIGLGIYATPSTDAALSNLPEDEVGSGAGIYKMASSLGSAVGTAVSLAVFTGLSHSQNVVLDELVDFEGRTDNVLLRDAAAVAMGVNVALIVIAIVSVMVMIPRGKIHEPDHAESPTTQPTSAQVCPRGAAYSPRVTTTGQ